MGEVSSDEGTPFPRVVAVHEKTVQALARGDIQPPASEPRAYRGRTARCITIRDERVSDMAMAAALALAEGDRDRLKITSEGEVIVLNSKRGS